MIRIRLRWQLLLVVVTALFARGVVAMATLYQVDDAMITFRYAENLAAGLGFVYNVGEHVLGTTSPLWTLILALTALLHANVPAAALWISLICSGVTAGAVYCLARALGAGKWALLAGLVYALNPRSVTVDICGLEVALFTFLTVTSLYRLRQGSSGEALLFGAFAALTRPEGALLFLSIVALIYFQRRRVAIVDWFLALVPLVAWVVFASLYFGSPIPNSITAKSGLYAASATPFLRRFAEMMLLTNPAGWLLWAGAIAATIFSKRRQGLVLLLTIVLPVYAASVAANSPRVFFWYPAPLVPLLSVLAAVGVRSVGQKVLDSSRRNLDSSAAFAATVVVAVLLVYTLPARTAALQAEMAWYESTHRAAASYLSAHAALGDRLLAEDIGHLGYIHRGTIIDRDGLVTPSAIAYTRAQQYADFVDSVAADWVFLSVNYPTSQSILSDRRFLDNHERVDYSSDDRDHSHALFQRRDSTQSP